MTTLIIPDVHGRTFWKEAVNSYPDSHVVFLGDYLDPYSFEGISINAAMKNLLDIIDFKRQNPERVTLLIGNHDIHYIDNSLCYSRKNDFFDKEIQAIFTMIGEGLFSVAHALTVNNKDYLFTHAGVVPAWWNIHFPAVPMQASAMADALNRRFSEMPVTFIHDALDNASFYRGGDYAYSSCVWTDMDELDMAESIPDIYQIVGHTQQFNGPVITSHYANLDCHKAFVLLDDGTIQNA